MSSYARMRAPEGCSGFAHQGFAMKPERDGTFLVDRRHVAEYTAHGFVPADEPAQTAASLAAQRVFAADPRPAAEPAAPVVVRDADPAKAAAFERLAALPAASLDRLAAMLERETAGQPDPRAAPLAPPLPAPLVEPPASPAPGAKLTEAQIEAMTKAQLVAYCKAHEIPMDSPIDADVLRMKVKHAEAQG